MRVIAADKILADFIAAEGGKFVKKIVGLVPVEQIIVDLKNLDAQNVLSEKL